MSPALLSPLPPPKRVVRACSWLVLGAALGAGCGTEEVVLQFRFPSEDTFLRSEQLRVRAMSVAERDNAACLGFVVEAMSDTLMGSIVRDTGNVPVCEVLAGELVVEDLPQDKTAYVVTALDEDQRVILVGCALSPEGAVPGALEVILSDTDAYRDHYGGLGAAACPSLEAKCAGMCE